MCRAVRDRAAVHRHRRRLLLPLCARRRRQGDRAERLGPRAGRRHDRLVRAAGHRRDRQHLGARRHRAGRDQRVGDAAEGAWPQGPRRTAAAGDPFRRRRLAGAPEGVVGLEAAGGEAAQERRARVPAERRGAERRRHLPQPGTGRDAARHRAPWRQGVLRGTGCRRHRRDVARARRPAHRGGFRGRPRQRRLRRADHGELARLRRVSSARPTARASSG